MKNHKNHLLRFCADTPLTLNAEIEQFVARLQQTHGLAYCKPDNSLYNSMSRPCRAFVVSSTADEAMDYLLEEEPENVYTGTAQECINRTIFMFPGQGLQYQGMGEQLYQCDPVFRRDLDHCADIVADIVPGLQLIDVLYNKLASEDIHAIDISSLLVFSFEYALARLIMSYGLQPDAMIGHSLGEYVAATLSGVFTLRSALHLVERRGRLLKRLPVGRMLGVPLDRQAVATLLSDEVSIAADQGSSVILAGTPTGISRCEQQLKTMRIISQPLNIERAGHSFMLDSVLDEFHHYLENEPMSIPNIAFIANTSGQWANHSEVVTPAYWVKQLRQTVLFDTGLDTVMSGGKSLIVEVGPGNVLTGLIAQKMTQKSYQGQKHTVINTVRNAKQDITDSNYLLNQLGRAWLKGHYLDFSMRFPGNNMDMQSSAKRAERLFPVLSSPRKLSLLPVEGNDPRRIFIDISTAQCLSDSVETATVDLADLAHRKPGEFSYSIKKNSRAALCAFFRDVKRQVAKSDNSFCFWTTINNHQLLSEESNSFISFIKDLVDIIAGVFDKCDVQLFIVTDNCLNVNVKSNAVDYAKDLRTVLNFVNFQQPAIAKVIDFYPVMPSNVDDILNRIIEEQQSGSSETMIRIENDKRYEVKRDLFLPISIGAGAQ